MKVLSNILVIGDIHLRLSPTKRRTDDIFEAQLQKLTWIGEKAKEINSEAIICVGDIGDSWDWRISMVNRVVEVLAKFPCPFYSILGNHDVPGRNPKLYKDTGMGLLSNMEVIKILDLEDQDAKSYQLLRGFNVYGFHSDASCTDDLINGKFVREKSDNNLSENKNIAIVHAPIGPESSPYSKGYKDLFINDFDVAIFGDIHDGWDPYESVTGCIIANPGALTRLTKKDIYRKPQVAIVYSDATVKYIEVPHAKPEDCFDLGGLESEKQELGKGFLAAIASRKITGDLNPKEYVLKIGTEAGYSTESIKEVIKYLDK